jgi:hypothetical protein
MNMKENLFSQMSSEKAQIALKLEEVKVKLEDLKKEGLIKVSEI